MRLHAAHSPIPDTARGTALALGNFDGVHLGHQAVIASAANVARERGLRLGASVFDPHPRNFFDANTRPFRLQTLPQMARAMGDRGVEELFVLGFDAGLASLSAEEFCAKILKDQLGAAHVSIGFNFHFGKGRLGSPATLVEQGAKLGFSVAIIEPVGDSEPVSSTEIRRAVYHGEMDVAARLLGRPWAIEGEVQKGFQRGRQIGFPTLNLSLGKYVRPKNGVYAVNVHVGDGDWRPGVASVGVNPTVGALPAPILEAHVFDFDSDLYGQTVEVEMIAFLREEQTFPDMESMTRQIELDAQQARSLLS